MTRFSEPIETPSPLAAQRRHFLTSAGYGVGWAALSQLLSRDGVSAAVSPANASTVSHTPALEARIAHFPARAKACIFIFLEGGQSQVDLYDPKPLLTKMHGQPLPAEMLKDMRFAFIKKETARLLGSPRKFSRHGQSGLELCDWLPRLATCADEMLVVRSMHTDQFNHHPAQLTLFSGRSFFGLPTVGAWMTWGLGSESENLPAFVVLTAGRGTSGGATLWQSGFLPSVHAGVSFRNQGDPVLNLSNPPGLPMELQRAGLDALAAMQKPRAAAIGDSEIASRMANYELAFRMQAAAPELIDLSRETQTTLDTYGLGRPDPPRASETRGNGGFHTFATNCLLARRLVERGVRFVQINHASWDHHSRLDFELNMNCRMADQPIAALIHDLRQRGLLDSTLVICASEFGRTPLGELDKGEVTPSGRDHHPHAFSLWLAGGGIKRGSVYGATDDWSWSVAQDPVHINDFHATLLHLFGLDHLRLTYRHQGLDARLTGVAGKVMHQWLG